MADANVIKVPDIGGAVGVDVIEILVKPGDSIKRDTPLVTLETDKASMEVPSSAEGVVKAIVVKVGDKVSEGDVLLELESSVGAVSETPAAVEPTPERVAPVIEAPVAAESHETQVVDVAIPDIGGATGVDVIEIMVKVGDTVEKDTPLLVLEGDKATMEIPSPMAGVVEHVSIALGDKVSQGSPVLSLRTSASSAVRTPEPAPVVSETPSSVPAPVAELRVEAAIAPEIPSNRQDMVSAGPAVRRMARELGVALSEVKGSGRKGRILTEDIQAYVKARLAEPAGGNGFALPQAPAIDFSRFGAIDIKPLNKIKRLTGANVHRSWITIPHVTQFDEADITELEAFRKTESERTVQLGYKLTILAFVCKVVSRALAAFPQFNASLDASGENLIYKQYCNIGIAVETPNGLVVPVIRDVDTLQIGDIAREMARLSAKARDKGLTPADMSGGCFTVSSLGGIGGTAFTPIVNAPEVAILGLSRSSIKPVYAGDTFVPRLMLPLSLSYDHRVIDGAEAARFTRFIADSLADIRRILL